VCRVVWFAGDSDHVFRLGASAAVRGRVVEMLADCETEEGHDQEALQWLVETALRCDALDAISASSRARATFVSLVSGSTFPSARSARAAPGVQNASATLSAGYLVMGTQAGTAPVVVPRRASELLPLAVVQMAEAGDIIGAGTLVLLATKAHADIASSSSAAVVALQAYFLRLQSAAASAAEKAQDWHAGHLVGAGVLRRCDAAYKICFEG
jgi:hypothetical protein